MPPNVTPLLHAPGIYMITNTANGKFYIGSSVNMQGRGATHLYLLRTGKHFNKHMQASFNHHGEKAFKFDTLCVVDKDNLLLFEQMFVDKMRPVYNVGTKVDRPSWGVPKSPETIQKISQAKRGIPLKLSPELRQRMRDRMLGNQQGVGVSNRRGVILSDETKAKIRAARATQVVTPSHRQAISKGLLSSWHTGKRPLKMTDEIKEIIIQRCSAGEPCARVAKEFGIHFATVCKFYRKWRLTHGLL
jgi:group I intron endonuclease